MKRFGLAVVLWLTLTTHATAQDIRMTAIGGSCEVVQIAGKSVTCSATPSAIYGQLPNGIILINVPLSDGQRVLGFIGDRDSQPRAEEYVLYLRRVRIARGNEQGVVYNVNGTCKMSVTTDGSIVHRITCNASDDQRNKFLLDFRGNGKAVTHFTPG